MLTELGGKGGRVCQPALEGTLRCPLIIRPNSEDAITGNLFGVLQAIAPRYWLPQLLNAGLGARRFRTQVYRNLRIELWQRQPQLPKHLLPWIEGSTEVDVVIKWENPPTTVFLEMKYRSELSETTTHNVGSKGYPSDQLIRNIRVGLYQCGWYDEPRLFEMPKRNFVVLLVSPKPQIELVERYRNTDELRRSIPHGELLTDLPDQPIVGQLSYQNVLDVLNDQKDMINWNERKLVDQLGEYFEFKLSSGTQGTTSTAAKANVSHIYP
jgi:hypothetical protein